MCILPPTALMAIEAGTASITFLARRPPQTRQAAVESPCQVRVLTAWTPMAKISNVAAGFDWLTSEAKIS